MNPFKKIASVFKRTPNNLQTQTTNSIANDFLRRGNFKSKQDVQLDQKFNPEMTVNGWMYAALNIRSDAFGEFCEENIVSESEKQENPYHPYLKLIEESKEIPEYEFWKKAISNYDNYGLIYFFVLRRVVKNTDGSIKHIGIPTKINILNSSKIIPLTHDGKIVGYREQVDATHKREFAPEQIIKVINPHPRNQDEPYSIYEAAKDYQYTINKGTEFAQNALINNINTPGILSTSEVLNDEEYDNLISRINSHEPGKAIVTDGTGNLTYTSISQSLDQAALPTLTELSRQTIFAVTGTSKTVLGIEESGVTRDTSKVQDKKFIKRAIAPVAKRIISAFNFDYRVRYPELYKQSGVKMVIKSIYDAAETSEQFDVQKKLFDDITEIIYSGYTKESAEKFMYGDIPFTDLELDAEDAQDIEGEQEDIDSPENQPAEEEQTEETEEENDGSEKDSNESNVDNITKRWILQNINLNNLEIKNENKGNPYHSEDGKFDFAPYKNFNGLKETVERISKYAKKVYENRNSSNWKDYSEYYNLIKNEREKLYKKNKEYDIDEANESISKWLRGDYTGDALTSVDKTKEEIFNPLDIALSQSIIHELGGEIKVFRMQASNEYYDGSVINKDKNLSTTLDKSWLSDPESNGLYIDKDEFNKGHLFEFNVKDKQVKMVPEVLIAGTDEITANDFGGQIELICEVDNNIKSTELLWDSTKNNLKIKIENQESEMHNHTSSDNYYMKALKLHVNEQGELDEYGKSIENKINQAKNNLLKEIRTIQLQAIRESSSKLSVNAFDYEDIRTEEQEDTIYNKIKNALRKYWFLILPLVGKERVIEDKNSIKISKEDNPDLTEEEIQEKNEEIKKAEVNLLGTKKVKDYIEQVSEKAAKSHTNTIYKTILDAVNKAENKILRNLFAKEYVEQFKQGEDKWFKSKPTEKQVKSKLGNQNFIKDNQSLYDSVRKKIEEGFSREEIQRAIRKEYVDLSRTRANILVGNEMARSITSSQYVADYELLRKTNMLDKAYKRLVSSTGDPCPVCKALIDKGDIPFTDPFLELGDTIQVENDGKTTTFTCNYETIESGVVHCNCHCDYQLIIKG